MKNLFSHLCLLALVATVISCSTEEPVQLPCSTPPQITAVEVQDAGCSAADGTVEILASGGQGGLMYSLNDSPFQEGNTFSQLSAGSYTVKVKDAQDCQSSQAVEVGESSTLRVSVVAKTASGCEKSEGSVELSAAGGAESYRYSLDGETFREEGVFSGLAAEEYTAHVKDAAGCVETETFVIKTGISFNASVKSIIEANCAISGCHVAGTGRADFTQFSVIKNQATTIKNYTQSGYMPPQSSGKQLSSSQIAAIACWVKDGAPQN